MNDGNSLNFEQKISEIERINAETRKLLLEGNLTHKKTTWYELTLVAAFIGGAITAGIAIAKLLFD